MDTQFRRIKKYMIFVCPRTYDPHAKKNMQSPRVKKILGMLINILNEASVYVEWRRIEVDRFLLSWGSHRHMSLHDRRQSKERFSKRLKMEYFDRSDFRFSLIDLKFRTGSQANMIDGKRTLARRTQGHLRGRTHAVEVWSMKVGFRHGSLWVAMGPGTDDM